MSVIDYIRRRWRLARARFQHFTTRFNATIRRLSSVIAVISWVSSLTCLAVLIVYAGFDHGHSTITALTRTLKTCQAVFVFGIIFNFVLNMRYTLHNNRLLKWIVDAGMLITLLPHLYPHPEHPWFPWLEHILYSNKYLYCALAAYSIVDLCYGLIRLTARRTNPSILLGSSFLFFIITGTFILMMPKCTYHGISFIDSLFVSTSAVCICGLTPVDLSQTFTPLGQLTLAVMFQIGGLGIITFTSFFAIFFSGRQSIYSQLLIRDMVYSKTINALIPTLLYILAFTVVIEAAGAVALYFSIPPELVPDMGERIGSAVFQAMSGFCNVGYSTFPGGLSNPVLMHSNQSIYIVMSILVFAGGIGFPILVNLKDVVKEYIYRLWSWIRSRNERPHPRHIFDLNTKIVLAVTIPIFVMSAITFFFLEADNTFAGMSLYERSVQSVFNAVMPRSGGFSSVNPANFLNITLILVMMQMWIGGSSQSMAGGIKVNSLGAILINLRAILSQKQGIPAFHRNIAVESVRRANAVVTLSIMATFLFTAILVALEPTLSLKSLVFEVVSATFNVGSSLGATPHLSAASRGVLCVAMFLGRVGIISLLSGLCTRRRDLSGHYPVESIIIN